ncbi:hypothetical protein I4U23_001439 [Adineta vaga]|nr:hypothetical protein I4U23_001439 [Adineta vaga]
MCKSKSVHRFVSLTWNCPCYEPRPQLRFYVRFGLLSFCIFFRIIAIILYATVSSYSIYGNYMAVLCTVSLCCIILTMLIDYYQYRAWWYYGPDGAYKKCRCCCFKQHFHPSHQRFLPIPLLGAHRQAGKLGNRPCQYTTSGNCPNLSLRHVVIFHAFDFKPHRRYQLDVDEIYIGFHRTTPEGAVGIAKEGFRISDKPPQMLGYGVYFARSFADTEGKARYTGSYICAKIRMGKVRIITFDEIHQVKNTKSWWDSYDTIYYAQREENRDEFCIKDPAQILKWIIIMDDDRLHRYGLDREFDKTCCHCI